MTTSRYITFLEAQALSLRQYRGHTIQQVCLRWRVWADFVTSVYHQPEFSTLVQAKAFIKKSLTPALTEV